MNKQSKSKMNIFKRGFSIFLVLDFIELILVGIALIPTLKQLTDYGQVMRVVASVITAVMVAVLLVEILIKVFLIRSTSDTFSWSSGRKGYVAAARVLLLFNIGAVLLNVLSLGGEGATLLNQGRMYLRILVSGAEMILAFVYLRRIKKFCTTMESKSV